MTAAINNRAQPSPIIGGGNDKTKEVKGRPILDETGAPLLDEAGNQILN